jgi:hypothetical protein
MKEVARGKRKRREGGEALDWIMRKLQKIEMNEDYNYLLLFIIHIVHKYDSVRQRNHQHFIHPSFRPSAAGIIPSPFIHLFDPISQSKSNHRRQSQTLKWATTTLCLSF